MFRKILIANRGEIAIRVMRACRELGIVSVAVHSDVDANAPHVLAADEAVAIGQAQSRNSYLHIPALIDAAKRSGAEAVHPGYGFLSENAAFARAVDEADLVFIGPNADVIAAMGDKTKARTLVSTVGVPVTPAVEPTSLGPTALHEAAQEIGYPLLVKAAAGGGGKGMRIVDNADELENAVESSAREAASAFGDGRVFLERLLQRPRHIEVQVLADRYGSVIHLGERECSLQRRHQKILEESPSVAVDAALRARLAAAAVAAARSVSYVSAGTVEFLLDDDGRFYFLEMNTRLQVEHTITEWVYGVDIVQAQIRIAAGEPLWLAQSDVVGRGHAIQCRIYAEDPANDFLPCTGTISGLREPAGPGVRLDSGIEVGYSVPIFYDPILAKLSVWAADRRGAIGRMSAALDDYVIEGVTTNVGFLREVLGDPEFSAGRTHIRFVEDRFSDWKETRPQRRRGPSRYVEADQAPTHYEGGPSISSLVTPWGR